MTVCCAVPPCVTGVLTGAVTVTVPEALAVRLLAFVAVTVTVKAPEAVPDGSVYVCEAVVPDDEEESSPQLIVVVVMVLPESVQLLVAVTDSGLEES